MSYANLDVSEWPLQELRLAFYDFTIRGEGAAPVIRAVIARWRLLGALSEAEAQHWTDALEWRDSGHFLPGWSAPPEMPPSVRAECCHGEADFISFESWRRERLLSA